jgi:hypothetical protein
MRKDDISLAHLSELLGTEGGERQVARNGQLVHWCH